MAFSGSPELAAGPQLSGEDGSVLGVGGRVPGCSHSMPWAVGATATALFPHRISQDEL